MKLRYFNLAEFDSPDAPGSGEEFMDEEFLGMLDKARHHAACLLSSIADTEPKRTTARWAA